MTTIYQTPEPDGALAGAVGAGIRRIRRRRHITQKDLAEQIGIRAGPLSNIESGKNLPSARVLLRLAQVLDVRVDDLLAAPAPTLTVVREDGFMYGTPDDLRPVGKCMAQVLRHHGEAVDREGPPEPAVDEPMLRLLDELTDAVLALEDLAGVQKWADIPLCFSFDQTEAGIADLAERVREALGISHGVIFDYIELLEGAGLRIIFCRLPAGHESIGCHDEQNRNAFIFIQDGATVERQLFRLMYEVGRLYIHTLAGSRDRTSRLTLKETDRRGKPFTPHRMARRFAAEMLMPERALRRLVSQLRIKPDEWNWDLLMRLKHRFGVSAESFLYRLEELGKIDKPLVESFRSAIHAHYAANGNCEPDSTYRVLNPNARIGDLVHCARRRSPDNPEIAEALSVLRRHGLKNPDTGAKGASRP